VLFKIHNYEISALFRLLPDNGIFSLTTPQFTAIPSSFIIFAIMEEKITPVFNKRIFWDVNFEQIDYDTKANFVIERVFERGDVEDIRQCRRYYGDEKVTAALLQAKYLPLHTIHFASAIIDKPLNEFRCYILRQLNPGLFPY
jgi:hypothetical protein